MRDKTKQEYGGALNVSLSKWLAGGFERASGDEGQDFSSVRVVPSANPQFGDYQCNECMPLAKKDKKNPREFAQAVVDHCGEHQGVSRVEVAGPGFINVHLDTAWLAGHIEWLAADSRLGTHAPGKGRSVVMDYGSPNITKPLHIGHLRSHNIGTALDRMYRFLGYRVIADNHLGDWGVQFGVTIMGYRHFGDEKAMESSPMEELERVYVASYERAQADEDWMEQCRRELVKLQSGDAENRALWQKFVSLSLQELERVYVRLGVRFDLVRGESHYHDLLESTVDDLLKKGLARESEGAIVAFLDDEGLPPCIVRKRDGGFNYATMDLATVASRVAEFAPDRIIYVTDERQQLHFKQIFAICRKLGVKTGLDHVWFGLMRLPDATFSTREGNVIKLETLLDEAESRALAIVKESGSGMGPEQQAEVARAVGIGAVKYADLSQNPQSLVTFAWEKALALDGSSGPYLQYACARIASVRTKYAERFPGKDPEAFPICLSEPVERSLALKVCRFPEVIVSAAYAYRPSMVTEWLYDLCQTYSTFYQNVPFLKAPEGARESRVRLCIAAERVVRQGLALLGIETPERI